MCTICLEIAKGKMDLDTAKDYLEKLGSYDPHKEELESMIKKSFALYNPTPISKEGMNQINKIAHKMSKYKKLL